MAAINLKALVYISPASNLEENLNYAHLEQLWNLDNSSLVETSIGFHGNLK